MLKLVDLTLYCHKDFDHPPQLYKHHEASIGFAEYIKDKLNPHFIKHLNYNGHDNYKGIPFTFFKRNNSFWSIPFKTFKYIKSLEPDIVLVQGLIFPLQVIYLRKMLGGKPKIIVQHHGEVPFLGIKHWLQKKADKSIDAYIFTSIGNANIWLEKNIISSKNRCYESLEASTSFTKKDKASSKEQVGMSGDFNFLWVGRLNDNKDPITILKGFSEFHKANSEARLYMIYQTEELLSAVKKFISNYGLTSSVTLVGQVDHSELETWFSATNFYISGSHREGSGYALIEAMACGCIPIVTNIPTFNKITSMGQFGFLYPPGDSTELAKTLSSVKSINKEEMSEAIREHSLQNLSFKKIAEDLYSICNQLLQPV